MPATRDGNIHSSFKHVSRQMSHRVPRKRASHNYMRDCTSAFNQISLSQCALRNANAMRQRGNSCVRTSRVGCNRSGTIDCRACGKKRLACGAEPQSNRSSLCFRHEESVYLQYLGRSLPLTFVHPCLPPEFGVFRPEHALAQLARLGDVVRNAELA
eukprot:360404-Pleurochrysis_carterae.AAC.1